MAREGLTADKLIGMYRRMFLIRQFEDMVRLLFLRGEMPGTIHQYQGQEAVAVGVCSALRRDDFITSTHRPHGHIRRLHRPLQTSRSTNRS